MLCCVPTSIRWWDNSTNSYSMHDIWEWLNLKEVILKKKQFLHDSFFFFPSGLLRLQQIYQGLQPGNETFQVETVKRISNVTTAIAFLKTLEETNRWSRKYIVLDCPTQMAKEIVVSHVRDVSLGRRTYHYLLSGLVSALQCYIWFIWYGGQSRVSFLMAIATLFL